MASSDNNANTPLSEISLDDVIVQEPKKVRGTVGERLWGPYRTHSGTTVSDRYSGGPWGLGK